MKKKKTEDIFSVKEKECLKSLTYQELIHLIVSFQNEKRRAYKLFLDCLEKHIHSEEGDLELPNLQKERIKFWKLLTHYEDLIQWCFEETTKRTQIKRKGK